MSSQVSNANLKEAIIHSVEYGAYPESEHVSSAELTPSVLPDLLADLEKTRNEVKADIRQLSKDVAPDIDGWIFQAKKLQADIERSKATARDIVQQAEAGERLRDESREAANKTALLEKEVAFNEALVETLARIRSIKGSLNDCQDAIVQGDIILALAAIKQADSDFPRLAPVDSTRAYDLLQKRSLDLRAAVAEQAAQKARELVSVNVLGHCVNVVAEGDDSLHTIESAVDVLSFLGAHSSFLERLKRDLDTAILLPRLSTGTNRLGAIRIEGSSMRAIEKDEQTDVLETLEDIWSIVEFLDAHLPVNLCSPLSELLLPTLFESVTTQWLDVCVPIKTEEMVFFQRVLDRVSKLATQIDALNWSASTNALKEWVQNAPRTWLAKRRETALGAVRSLLFTRLREKKTVERVETQMISKGDALMGKNKESDGDAWDEDWGEEETEEEKKSPTDTKQGNDDDEDASAWDMDDDIAEQSHEPSSEETKAEVEAGEEDDDADAWGWGDEEQAAQQDSEPKAGDVEQGVSTEKSPMRMPAEKEMTLRETYTVTAVPDGILEIIEQSVADAATLTDPSFTHTPIGPAASALYTLPTFALAMYRATAATAYGKLETGNMLIYNDSTRLADQLRSFVSRQAEKDSVSPLATNLRPSSRLRLDNEIKSLDSFARRAYSTEMESQRTILGDMLDGAQGFAGCTEQPIASECQSAVDTTADRLREMRKQWEPVLSRSALLQSLGSLLSTVISKMIMDIEDLSDIGEEESKRLRSYCDRISEVKELFVQEGPDGQTGDLTGIYCPNWFKFQYLGEILESSLADIKYLWTEGELRLEYEVEEVVELIQALFADSDYRRKAITDIRRSSRW